MNRHKPLAEFTWVEFEKNVKSGRVKKILLPMGSLEQHGPHLPLSTDTIIADYVAAAVSKVCPECYLIPTVGFGSSLEHLGFPGTLSLETETVTAIITDIVASLLKSGLKKIFIINGHGGNRATIDSTLMKVKYSYPEVQAYCFTIIDMVNEKYAKLRRSKRKHVGHADELETSMMLAINSSLVDRRKVTAEEPTLPKGVSFEHEDMAKVSFGWRARDLTKTGTIGDPSSADAATGRALLNYAVQTIAETINGL
jgi:creatinine amidohydrolase